MSDLEIVVTAGYILAGLSVFFFARMLMREEETRAAQENLNENKNKSSNSLIKLTKPFFNQYVLPFVRSKPFWDSQRKYYKRKLIAAGLKDELNADEMISFKIILILFFPLVGGVLKTLDFIDFSLITILASGIGGWFYPDLWAKGRIEKRQKEILRSMPFVVDLLALSTEAGMDFVASIGKVVEKATPSPLVDELGQVLREIRVGSSRAEALREMSLRIDMLEINSFVAVLISADQMGGSIGKVLRQQSDMIRNQRVTRAEKAGAKAASQVILPVVLFIVPAVMLMVFGPFILSFIGAKS